MVNYKSIRLIFLASACSVAILQMSLPNTTNNILEIVALISIATIGLSHGSLDWLLARHWGLRDHFMSSLIFFIFYIAIAVLVLICWHFFPSSTFSIFLLLSIEHFAHDWRYELNRFYAYNLGIAIICIPSINFPHEVKTIFGLLIPTSNTDLFINICQYVGYIALVFILLNILLFVYRGTSKLLLSEIIILPLIGLILPPLLSFSLYFCLLHSPKHWVSIRVIGAYKKTSEACWNILWPTGFCLLMGAIAFYTSFIHSMIATIDRTIFIGLAALTVPHWLLVEMYPKWRYLKSEKHRNHCRVD